MPRKKKMTEEDILNAVNQELDSALGGDEYSKLNDQRAKSMEYYLGEPYGNERSGRSQVRTREVLDTIEWTKPELMKLFSSEGDTVRFEPESPADVAGARQATDYVNYIFHRRNPGFKILYQWITDGLLQKDGVVKAWWDTSVNKTREDYEGLSQVELEMLAAPDHIEVADVVQNPDGTYDCGVISVGEERGVVIENIPPEEFLIATEAKCIEDSPFCAHRTPKTLSDLKTMGYDVEEIKNGIVEDNEDMRPERIARHSYDDTPHELDNERFDESMEYVWFTEAYIRLDRNRDGIAEILKVAKVGNVVLEVEETDTMPFCAWSPIIISHKFNGLSIADLIMDLQRIQSQLLRNILDNQYLTNNGRYAILDGQVNLEDMLSGNVHGVVREKVPGAVRKLDVPQLGNTAFQMLEYMDRLREKRTGVSERTQGIESNQLGPNTAATAVNQVMTAAQQRIELIARVFAETGLKDLFRLIYKLVLQNDSSKHIFRLRDEYVEVNPREWKDRADMSVVVGLGNGSKEAELYQMSMVFQQQQQLMANPATASLVSPTNVFNLMEDMVKLQSRGSAGRYFTNPQSPEAQQRAQQQQMAQQAAQKQQQAVMQAQLENEAKKAGAAVLKAQTDAQEAQLKDQREKAELAQDAKEHEDDIALRTAELDLEYELEKAQGRGVDLG